MDKNMSCVDRKPSLFVYFSVCTSHNDSGVLLSTVDHNSNVIDLRISVVRALTCRACGSIHGRGRASDVEEETAVNTHRLSRETLSNAGRVSRFRITLTIPKVDKTSPCVFFFRRRLS